MKQIFLLAVLSGIAFAGVLTAQETDFAEENLPVQEGQSTVVDADNPGMGLLDQATEAKLRASTVLDLSQVISLCQRAKKTGLSGENLKYCNNLLASTQLQRGLFLAQSLLNPQSLRGDWTTARQRALLDLEEAVAVIKDQPTAYLRIAQLNLLPDGSEKRAKEALQQAIQCAKSEPVFQLEAIRLLAKLEPDPEKLEVILATAAKEGTPQLKRLHAITLLELNRSGEAMDILKRLIEAESENNELHDNIVAELAAFGKAELAMELLALLRQKGTDDRKDRLDLTKAELFFRMGQNDEALALLASLSAKLRENKEAMLDVLMLRANIHLAMDDADKALKDIQTAEKFDPDFYPTLQLKYGILMVQKKFDEALEVTKKLQTLEPEDRRNLVREIHVLTEQEKYDDALAIAQELRKQKPDEPQWILVLIEIYSKQKAYDNALALVEEQLKKNPDDLRWIGIKTQIFMDQKKWDEAVKWLESCLKKNPDSQDINLTLIEVLYNKKSYQEVKDRVKSLLEKEPGDIRLLRLDSQVSISLGLHRDAVKSLEKVIEITPKDYTSLNNLSWLLSTSPVDSVRNGRRALELAEKASELSQYKEAFVLSTLAAAHAEVGNFEKAREWSLKGIDLAKKTTTNKTEEEQKELLEHLQNELDHFKRDEPFRELLKEGN